MNLVCYLLLLTLIYLTSCSDLFLTYNAEIYLMEYFIVYHRAKQRAVLRNGNIDHFTFIDRSPLKKNTCYFVIISREQKNVLHYRSNNNCTDFLLKIIWTRKLFYILLDYTLKTYTHKLRRHFSWLSKYLNSQGVYSWYT